MFVQNHHSLEELQRLTKALTKKRIWLRHQAVVLAKQGHSAPAIARALGCSQRFPEEPKHLQDKDLCVHYFAKKSLSWYAPNIRP